jgi:hypothetical protein
MASQRISINRAPVLTLWAAIVAQRIGFDENTGAGRGCWLTKNWLERFAQNRR